MMLVGELLGEYITFVLARCLYSMKIVTRSMSELVSVHVLYGLTGAELQPLKYPPCCYSVYKHAHVLPTSVYSCAAE